MARATRPTPPSETPPDSVVKHLFNHVMIRALVAEITDTVGEWPVTTTLVAADAVAEMNLPCVEDTLRRLADERIRVSRSGVGFGYEHPSWVRHEDFLRCRRGERTVRACLRRLLREALRADARLAWSAGRTLSVG